MTRLKIEGMTCRHCAMAVTKALSNVPGVDQVIEVSLERREAQIEGKADHAALIAAVENEGYTAQVLA
jgi:copper chaperone